MGHKHGQCFFVEGLKHGCDDAAIEIQQRKIDSQPVLLTIFKSLVSPLSYHNNNNNNRLYLNSVTHDSKLKASDKFVPLPAYYH